MNGKPYKYQELHKWILRDVQGLYKSNYYVDDLPTSSNSDSKGD